MGLPLQRNAEFSYAVAVMDKFGGWEEGNEREDQIGARFGASMWIHTKAVVCTGPRHMENFMMNKMNSITEAVNGAWGILYEDHEWIPQNSIQRQECEVLKSSHCDIEVPCVVQWRMLWYSAPTSLKNDSLNDGVIHEKCDKAVNMAIKTCFTCPFWRSHTPKIFLLGRHRS